MKNNFLILTLFLLITPSLAYAEGSLPTTVHQCVQTTIDRIETRLVDGSTGKPIRDSGSAVKFSNGGYQVSYDNVPAISASKRGDKVTMCLIGLPKNCPAGDNRGKTYLTTNSRTGKSWTLPDSEHMCGGA